MIGLQEFWEILQEVNNFPTYEHGKIEWKINVFEFSLYKFNYKFYKSRVLSTFYFMKFFSKEGWARFRCWNKKGL